MSLQSISLPDTKYPEYRQTRQRLNSYTNWPTDKAQSPDVLAAAGLFYLGEGDRVKCFHCGGGLVNWDPTDDPWEEHAKWFSRCHYLLQKKGAEFIARVQERQNVLQAAQAHSLPPAQSVEPNTNEVNYLNNDMVTRVIEMGFSRDLVEAAIKEHIDQSGSSFDTTESLFEAVLQRTNGNGAGQHQAINISEEEDLSTPSQGERTGEENPAEAAGGNKTAKDGDKQADVSSLSSVISSLNMSESEIVAVVEQRLCKICMVENVSMTFLPCGHLCCCTACSPSLTRCPICRAHIKNKVRTYMS